MSNVLYRIGRVCTRRRWRVLFAWVAMVIALVVVGQVAGGQFVDRLQIPGVDSQKATNLLLETFPSQAGGSMQVVFHVPNGTISDGPAASAIAASLEAMATVPHVVQPAPALVKRVSSDGTTVLATVQFDDEVRALPRSVYYEVVATTEVATAAGVQVEFGGQFPQLMEQPSLGGTEGIGLLAAMVILLFAFGSVIAMGLPIGTALFGLGAGIAAITCLSAFVDMPSTSEMLASMIGLGVGIDYALFIITRHRAGLHRGLTVEDASGRSIATAGQAVLIAGGTVVIAICGLAVAGIPMITFMGIGAAIVVAVMVTSSLTLLPALMGFAGHNIDRFGLPGTKRVSEGSITNIDGEYHGWARWAQHVSRHPVVYLFVGLAFMLTLAAPILDLRLGQTDSSQSPTTSTLRRSYDLLAEGFGPGFNGPSVLAVNLEG
ncbi:MAG: MMPL family transporter, partial [Actinomycetota bacterium]